MVKTHGINTRVDLGGSLDSAAWQIHTQSALFSTKRIVEKVEDFAARMGKRVLYVLFYNGAALARRITEGTRFDQEFIDFLTQRNLPFVDMLEAHVTDFAQFKISVQEYIPRYYIGHYNPMGNFFTAFAIKGKLVTMLDPKPPSYLSCDGSNDNSSKPRDRSDQ